MTTRTLSIIPAVAFAGLMGLIAGQSLAAPSAPAKKDEPSISAPHAILMDAQNGSVLFERDADALIFPASLAKLMTVEYVLHEIEEGRVKLTDEYVVSENAWRKGGAPSHSSTMFAALHSKVSVDDLLHAVVIQSANDACIVLAEGIAGNEDEFAARLTKRARQIGLTKSVFTNANGLPDPDEKVTARELAMLARHIILNYPKFYPVFGQPEFTWNKIRQRNRNPLLGMSIGADGLKTGYTKEAGYGLVGSAVQSGLRLIAVVTGVKTAKERAEEGKKLLEWGFRNFEMRPLFAEGQIIGEAKVFGGAKNYVPLVSPGVVRVMVPKAGGERLIARIVYTGPLQAPVEKDVAVASLRVWRNDNMVLEVPLKTAEAVGKGTVTQRAFDAVTELVINLFRAGVARL
ncbi:MAG TPA: D-alanyl-D-alanine carboxypeptidase family protein [Pseudolabrys sp.]|jgi:D-alanyl-D-alanine carboxypeptidase (penicillin-binding protein 5/6)|nr:D-alanyl-D-alanine carboxypeptidase family protein [Pseudolabrys sp.]